ncbi:hypothetical protein EBB79_10100 [Parasedimentitalea marina]|uniref:Lipoprotein n=2 Tax=Parasedimentitalea marina TaxID=2483033 RepID=A0A3T0N2I3_9RHOB|nr:hypothetical protein EBB79_10100 [Parasedimentitalea marina]
MVKSFKNSVFAPILLGLVSCTPLTLYYKPGAEVSRMQTDTLGCETQALKDAPVANEVRQSAPVFYPGDRYCDGTNCHYSPGYWIPGHIYTVDVNLDLRRRVEQNCMAVKGYQRIQLQNCNLSIAKAAGTAQTTRLPQLSDKSCAIKNKDGSFQIVEPG